MANLLNLPIPVTANYGGTGQSSYTTGDILYASSATALSNLSDVAVGNALISGGVGVAPSWGKIALSGSAAAVTGTLPVGNGGTGTATAFTQGSVIFAGASGVYSQNNSAFFWDNTNSRLSIQGSSNNLVLFQSSAAATFVPVLTMLAPNLSNQTVTIDIGVNDRSGPVFNTGYIGFNYVSFADSSNALVLGINHTATTADNLLTISGTGDVTATAGNLICSTAGKGLQFIHAAVSGGVADAILVTGAVTNNGMLTVSNSAITSSHVGFTTLTMPGGFAGTVWVICSNGSFTLHTGSLDTGTYSILFIKAL